MSRAGCGFRVICEDIFLLTIQSNSLRGTIKGQNVSGSLRRNPHSMRATPGRYRIVKTGVDPALGGVMVLKPAQIFMASYQKIELVRLLSSADSGTIVISSRGLGSAASLVLDGVPQSFYTLPEVGDEVVVS